MAMMATAMGVMDVTSRVNRAHACVHQTNKPGRNFRTCEQTMSFAGSRQPKIGRSWLCILQL